MTPTDIGKGKTTPGGVEKKTVLKPVFLLQEVFQGCLSSAEGNEFPVDPRVKSLVGKAENVCRIHVLQVRPDIIVLKKISFVNRR